ncbi:Smr/MutS family protein [Tardiphaga sp. 804_B3_N1_9]|uniref:Smr/MutS family protein n=1 Tax=Tardiphaga TaxID=1395974 RepID=UPI0015864B93|nr:Smr/MutS family protein [Tardiphaga robiniae]NUU44991.1 DNA mismatch repair protein MutS [Tardiphaga robiniae]
MKRSRPPQLIDPVTPRRRRVLSEEERALWELVAKQVKPLRKKRVVKPELEEDGPTLVKVAAPRTMTSAPPAVLKTAKPAPPPVPVPPLAPLGRRERSQLSRGRKDIDARIDLHGMTQTRAHHALSAFLHRASHDGMTFVLVITGKGRTTGPESERGVLRRQVPLWLGLPEFRSLVVGFEEAHIGHGGAGALYVRIRRARS